MTKVIGTRGSWLILISAVLFILSGCYFHNTPVFPAPEGFHIAESSPFLSGEYPVTGMANNGSMIAAVSYAGMIAYSANSGISWTKVEPENITGNFVDGIHFNAIAWGGGFFLAVGDEGRAAYSADGIHWQYGVIGPMSPENILCVAAGSLSGKMAFTAAGTNGRIAHAVDSPAGPWYMADQAPFGTVENYGAEVRALAWGKIKGLSLFVAAGDDGRIAILKDMSGKWYGGRAGAGGTFRTLAFGNDRFIAAGDNGLIKYSLDPVNYTWKNVKDDTIGLRAVRGIEFDPVIEHFVLYTGDTVVGFSEFGDSWNASNFESRFLLGGSAADPEKISALSCTASRIVLGGSKGTIVYSN
jgi:hypothetical protein